MPAIEKAGRPQLAVIVPVGLKGLAPDQGLPGAQPHPEHPIVIPPDKWPTHPIVLPPGSPPPLTIWGDILVIWGGPWEDDEVPPSGNGAHPEHPIVIPPSEGGSGDKVLVLAMIPGSDIGPVWFLIEPPPPPSGAQPKPGGRR
jgi:hypothetical protein